MDKPCVPVVVVLRKGHGRTSMHPRESLQSSALGVVVESFRFFVVKLWELEADDLLAHGPLVALPFLPFARGASDEKVRSAFVQLRSSPESRAGRNDLLVGLAVNSAHVFRETRWLDTIPLEIRMKSPAYEQILAEGRAAGVLTGQRQMFARWVGSRLGEKAAETLLARISAASGDVLDRATDLLGKTEDNAVLLAALKKLLPRAKRKA